MQETKICNFGGLDNKVEAIDLNRSEPDWHYGGSVNRRYLNFVFDHIFPCLPFSDEFGLVATDENFSG
jgi:hypothetical protein